ncbi:MAG: hypothetical protein JSV49_12665 [Thermoplasmata archaeon]|nr:MAG: hypothetical protein JSV49_12665 [Thermoplasmata archaeon]
MNKMLIKILIPLIVALMVSVGFATVVYEPENDLGVNYADYEEYEPDTTLENEVEEELID